MQSNAEGVGEQLANIIDIVLHVLRRDKCLDVRKNAALNLLHCVQDKPARSVALSLSLSEVLMTIGWDDENVLTLPTRKRYQREYLISMRDCTSSEYRRALKDLWGFVTSNPSCDHCVRVLLINMWIYVFGKSTPRILTHAENVDAYDVIKKENCKKQSVDPVFNLHKLDQLMRYQNFLS
jgi:hypothetical protein